MTAGAMSKIRNVAALSRRRVQDAGSAKRAVRIKMSGAAQAAVFEGRKLEVRF